jgi:hypothetical protein
LHSARGGSGDAQQAPACISSNNFQQSAYFVQIACSNGISAALHSNSTLGCRLQHWASQQKRKPVQKGEHAQSSGAADAFTANTSQSNDGPSTQLSASDGTSGRLTTRLSVAQRRQNTGLQQRTAANREDALQLLGRCLAKAHSCKRAQAVRAAQQLAKCDEIW